MDSPEEMQKKDPFGASESFFLDFTRLILTPFAGIAIWKVLRPANVDALADPM